MNESDPTGDCGRLADYLYDNKDSFMHKWLMQARNDQEVLSDGLSNFNLTDHVPKIFDAILEALRNQCSQTHSDVQAITARHTVIRWVQSYDLRAVLREVSLLRTEFVYAMFTFNEQNPAISGSSHRMNASIIHRILDGVVLDATETFFKLDGRAAEK